MTQSKVYNVVSSQALENLVKYSNDKFFSITWVKNDDTLTKRVARLMPRKPDSKPATMAQSKYLLIYVMGEGYRSVARDRIVEVNAKHIRAVSFD